MTREFSVLLAGGFLFGVILLSAAIGFMRRRRGSVSLGPARFLPHWQVVVFLGFSLFAMLAAVLAPLLVRLMGH